jgi:hypothetical protein
VVNIKLAQVVRVVPAVHQESIPALVQLAVAVVPRVNTPMVEHHLATPVVN